MWNCDGYNLQVFDTVSYGRWVSMCQGHVVTPPSGYNLKMKAAGCSKMFVPI